MPANRSSTRLPFTSVLGTNCVRIDISKRPRKVHFGCLVRVQSAKLSHPSLSHSLSLSRALPLSLSPSLPLSLCLSFSLSETHHPRESQAMQSRADPIIPSPRGVACTNKLIKPRNYTPGEERRLVLCALKRKSSHATCTPGVKHRPQE